jgi:hypothetical protein
LVGRDKFHEAVEDGSLTISLREADGLTKGTEDTVQNRWVLRLQDGLEDLHVNIRLALLSVCEQFFG